MDKGIAIVIATYCRPDGKTPFYLSRAIDSILKQTYKKYQIFIIGDDYTNEVELRAWASIAKIKYLNLPIAKERSKYKPGSYELWCAGGVNAGLTGIELALKDGYDYVCHLDHDDYWNMDHLQKISEMKKLNPLFCCTMSTHKDLWLPYFEQTNEIHEIIPVAEGLITSSTCINYRNTEIRPRDVFADTGVAYPADADLWQRLAKEMEETGKKGYLYTSLTCHHDEEGYSLNI